MKKRLLAVQGPLQFIAGYLAMEWYRKIEHGDEDSESVLLMYDFLMPKHIEPEFSDVIMQLASFHKWHNIVFIPSSDMKSLLWGKYSDCIKRLQSLIGETSFDEIYLAQDHCGDGSPLIINAYPNAVRIIYGDSFGLVGDMEISSRFNWNSPFWSFFKWCKLFLRGLIYGRPRKYTFDIAILTLPIDWSEKYLEKVHFLVPCKNHVLNTIKVIQANLKNLNNYCDFLLKKSNSENKYLFLLSNFSASGMMSQKSEIAMYLEIITTIVTKGETIFLKAHPRSALEVINTIIDHLKGSYEVIVIDDSKLSRMPIELWSNLINECTVVPIFSTSAISIKYIYDKQVMLPLSSSMINKFVFKGKTNQIIKNNELIFQSIANLETWDGKSVLWKGTP